MTGADKKLCEQLIRCVRRKDAYEFYKIIQKIKAHIIPQPVSLEVGRFIDHQIENKQLDYCNYGLVDAQGKQARLSQAQSDVLHASRPRVETFPLGNLFLFLLQSGKSPSTLVTVHTRVLRFLLDDNTRSENLNDFLSKCCLEAITSIDREGNTLLQYAILKGNAEAVSILAVDGRVDLIKQNKSFGLDALSMLCCFGCRSGRDIKNGANVVKEVLRCLSNHPGFKGYCANKKNIQGFKKDVRRMKKDILINVLEDFLKESKSEGEVDPIKLSDCGAGSVSLDPETSVLPSSPPLTQIIAPAVLDSQTIVLPLPVQAMTSPLPFAVYSPVFLVGIYPACTPGTPFSISLPAMASPIPFERYAYGDMRSIQSMALPVPYADELAAYNSAWPIGATHVQASKQSHPVPEAEPTTESTSLASAPVTDRASRLRKRPGYLANYLENSKKVPGRVNAGAGFSPD